MGRFWHLVGEVGRWESIRSDGGILRLLPGLSRADNTANVTPTPKPTTIPQILRDEEPMGDLSRFVIEDMTPDEELPDEFFRILEDA